MTRARGKVVEMPTKQPSQDDVDRLHKRIIALLKGEADCPNETIEYLVGQLREVSSEHLTLSSQAQQMQNKLEMTNRKLTELVGQRNRLTKDILHFDGLLPKETGDGGSKGGTGGSG